MEAQSVIALVVGTVVVLLVPALVWSTSIAGLYQAVQDKIRRACRKSPGRRQRAQSNLGIVYRSSTEFGEEQIFK